MNRKILFLRSIAILFLIILVQINVNSVEAKEDITAQEVLSRVKGVYKDLGPFRVKVDNYFGQGKKEPDEIVQITFSGINPVSRKVLKHKSEDINTGVGVNPCLPVEKIEQMEKHMEVRVAETKEKEGVKYYLLESGQDMMKMNAWINGEDWSVSELILYMGEKKFMETRFTYLEAGGFNMPHEMTMTVYMEEEPTRAKSLYRDYEFGIELAETEKGIFAGSGQMEKLNSMHAIVKILPYKNYIIAINDLGGRLYVYDKKTGIWYQSKDFYAYQQQQKGAMTMRHGVPVNGATVYPPYLFIATYGAGLSRVNLDTGGLKVYKREDGLLTDNIGDLVVEGDTLWLGFRQDKSGDGSYCGGLMKLNLKDDKLEKVFSLEGNTEINSAGKLSSSVDRIWAFCSKDTVYISQDGMGKSASYNYKYIAGFNKKSGEFIPVEATSKNMISNFLGFQNGHLFYTAFSEKPTVYKYNVDTGTEETVFKFKGQVEAALVTESAVLLGTMEDLYIYDLSSAQLQTATDNKVETFLYTEDEILLIKNTGFGNPRELCRISLFGGNAEIIEVK